MLPDNENDIISPCTLVYVSNKMIPYHVLIHTDLHVYVYMLIIMSIVWCMIKGGVSDSVKYGSVLTSPLP